MTPAEKRAMLATMTEVDDEEILSTYLKLAEGVVLRRCYPFDQNAVVMPECYETAQLEIACYFIDKRGAEGETEHSENGMIRMYEDGDVPPTLLRRIIPMAGVIR